MKPVVFWYHGFNSDSAANAAELQLLDDAGFEAIGIDTVGHGTRRRPDLDAIAAAPREETLRAMLEMVDATARELPSFVDRYTPRPVSLAGVSMGAMIVYRALTLEPRITAAVAMLGTPEYIDIDAMHETALLSITAANDVNVPPAATRAMHERLTWKHARHIEIADAQHLMKAEQWEYAMSELIAWLVGHA